MATAQKILLDPHDTGLWKIKQTDEVAKKASELLQTDLEASQNNYFYSSNLHEDLSQID